MAPWCPGACECGMWVFLTGQTDFHWFMLPAPLSVRILPWVCFLTLRKPTPSPQAHLFFPGGRLGGSVEVHPGCLTAFRMKALGS